MVVKSNPLVDKSKDFALLVVRECQNIQKQHKEYILTKQLIRSGTSVGANIWEGQYGHGPADFIAKLQIALKECNETRYWIVLLTELGYLDDCLLEERCIEIIKMLTASLNIVKAKTDKK